MSQPWWSSALQWMLWGILMAVIMGWVARSRLRARPRADAGRLYHPPSTLVLGLVELVFFTALAVVSNVFANETTTWWTTAVFVGFAALSLPILADYFLARHEVSEKGLSYGSMTGRRGRFEWWELRRVTYSPSLKWFRLETHSGAVARVSVMLVGLPEFARLLLAHAPAGVIDREALPVLEATAAGHPPPVWG
ncbi:MAG: hypothetical protein KJ025_14535 [Burkholderiales bacterium]|nr:hypothetical protein [Burkholderiales bacterium]